jgi:hypothetical protein
MTAREGARASACAAGSGVLWGWAAAAAMLVFDVGVDEVVAVLAVALVYGGAIGVVVGLLVGLPIAIVAGQLRRRFREWRAVSTGLAVLVVAVPTGLVLLLGGAVPGSGWLAIGLFCTAVAVSTWRALAWVFEPLGSSRQQGGTLSG